MCAFYNKKISQVLSSSQFFSKTELAGIEPDYKMKSSKYSNFHIEHFCLSNQIFEEHRVD